MIRTLLHILLLKKTLKRGDTLNITEAPGGGFAISLIAL